MLKIKQFVFNPFGENTFVVYDSESLEAMIVDPGMTASREQAELDRFISDNKLKVVELVNTHLHLDHCFGDNYVRDKYGVKVKAGVADAFLGKSLGEQARRFGINVSGNDSTVEIDAELKEGDIVKLGSYDFVVLEVPGHSPGSIALYCASAGVVFVGDVLFRGSIGRTDLEGGNHSELLKNIREKLLTLPDNTIVAPGHMEPTTIGQEKTGNPFLA